MAIVTINDDILYSIADAIRSQTKTSSTFRPSQMASAILGIEGGSEEVADFIQGTVSTISNRSVSYIGSYAFYRFSNLEIASFENVYTVEPYAFYSCSKLSDIHFPNVTNVKEGAFARCTKLTELSFPNLISIGSSAFQACTSVTSLSFPNAVIIGDNAFESCNKITNIAMSSVASIGNSAFVGCNSLATVQFPNVEIIGSYAFYSLLNLSSISAPKATTIGEQAFCSCFRIVEANFPSVTHIGSSAFQNCYELSYVSFPAATSINEFAFAQCPSLTSVNFPSVITIGANAFCSCTNLSQVSLPLATTIGESAFAVCTLLTSISIPSATTISSYAFSQCKISGTISLPEVQTIGEKAFYSCRNILSVYAPKMTTIGKQAFDDCRSLSYIYAPNVTSIASYAFNACYRLQEASFPNLTTLNGSTFCYCSQLLSVSLPSLTTMSSFAFYSCSSLVEMSFPAMSSVPSYAFYYCLWLETVTLDTVHTIAANAFTSCSMLTSLFLPGSSVANLMNVNAFYNTAMSSSKFAGEFGSIFVPASLVSAYKTASRWSTYESRITSYIAGGNPNVARVRSDGGIWHYSNTLLGAFTYTNNNAKGIVEVELLEQNISMPFFFTFNRSQISSLTIKTTSDPTLNPTGFRTTLKKTSDNSYYMIGTSSTFGGQLIIENIIFDGDGIASSGNGGAIYHSKQSWLTINNCSFVDFITSASGGAIYANSAVILNYTTSDTLGFYNCTTIGDYGGAIYSLGGPITINNGSGSTLEFDGCTATKRGGALLSTYSSSNTTSIIINNQGVINFNDCSTTSTSDGCGGAISCTNTSDSLVISNSGEIYFVNCESICGGAVYCGRFIAEDNTGTITFDSCVVPENTASTSGGGAIKANDVSITSLNDGEVIFVHCGSYTDGGALYVRLNNINIVGTASNPVMFEYCVASGGSGGAIYHEAGVSSTLQNVSFIDCDASINGDAIYEDVTTASYTNIEIDGVVTAYADQTSMIDGVYFAAS